MCLIAGYFSQISTLADVQENVMRYLHVMSRPKVIDHEHDTVWTEAYVDTPVSVLQRFTSQVEAGSPLLRLSKLWFPINICI